MAVPNRFEYETRVNLTQKYPMMVMEQVMKLPFFGVEQRKKVGELKRVTDKMLEMADVFIHFF